MPEESPPIGKESPFINLQAAIHRMSASSPVGRQPPRLIRRPGTENKTPTGSPTHTTERRKKSQDIQSDEQDKDLKMAMENSLLDQQDPEIGGGATLVDIGPEFTDPPEPQTKDSEPTRQGHRSHASQGNRRSTSYINKQESLKTKLENSLDQRRLLDKKLLKAESIIRERDMQINGLTAAITRLQSRDGVVARDDTYFANEFSDIANSIVEWTMRYFPKTKADLISELSLLPPELGRLVLCVNPNGEKLLAVRKSRLQIISSIVIDNLYGQLFGVSLLGAFEGSNLIQAISPLLKGTEFQIQRWRSLTHILITNSIEYEKNFSADVLRTVNYIDKLVSALAPPESVAMLREADLYKIVDRAARASVEVRRQLDIIKFNSPRPSDRFDSKTMEDIGQEDDPEDLEAGGAIVQIVLCPSVRRQICGAEGLSEGPGSLIMKAKVAIIFPDD